MGVIPNSQCKKCILDLTIPGVVIQADGICNICKQSEILINEYGTGEHIGIDKLSEIINKIKVKGKNQKYDCVIGVSGGTDSSYVVHKAVTEWKLRPLLAYYDNTWSTSIAEANIGKLCNKLNLELDTFVLNNHDSEDLVSSFFLAGVAELDAATDLGYAYFLRKICKKYKIKYLLEAHSFTEEGITPLNNNYFDGAYIRDIHKKYGKRKLQNYPLMTLGRFIKSIIFSRIEIIRPLWYLDYSKEEARKTLASMYNWEYYGNHHHENLITAYYHSVYLRKKFDVYSNVHSLAAQVRSKRIQREYALNIYEKQKTEPETKYLDYIEYFQIRTGISSEAYFQTMSKPGEHWSKFKTYKRQFEILAPFFLLMSRYNLVPRSFYIKYCAKKAN